MDTVELKVTSETCNVSLVVQKLEEFCKTHSIEVDTIENIAIACDEALTNIMMHGYEGRVDGDIEVKFDINQDTLSIMIVDYGKRFKPGRIERKPKFKLDEWEVGGFGLILMNEFMDELRFSHDEKLKRNSLIMRKYLE